MLKQDFLKKLMKEVTGSIPTHLQSIKKDVEKNCRLAVNKCFSTLDVVTREEFDAQTKVLARTRKKLEELEELVKSLEKKKHK